MRKQIAAANWKMNLTFNQAEKLLDDVLGSKIELADEQLVLFAVPFPYLITANKRIAGTSGYAISAQNCSNKLNGAFTGEVSVEMLQSIGINYCVIGHSERREYFSETNQMLAEKVNLCLKYGITPVFCCGEPLEIREKNEQNAYVQQQLEESLFHLSPDQISSIVIAYEPIWAIGTGKTATSAQAQQMHHHLRAILEKQYGKEKADNVSILYGGSVKANNAQELFSNPDVDGGLVGGASLAANDFKEIIKALKK